jgi:hypothetical protein
MILQIKQLDSAYKANLARTEDLHAKYGALAAQVQSIEALVQIRHQQAHLEARVQAQAPSTEVPTTAASPQQREEPAIEAVRTALTRGSIAESRALLLTSPSSSFYSQAHEVHPGNNSPVHGAQLSPATRDAQAAATKFNPAAPAFNPRGVTEPAKPTALKSTNELPTSELLAASLYAQLPQEEAISTAAADFVAALCPQQAQVQYRDSVVALLQRNFRSALNCESLEVGLHRLLCFLPDDAVKVTAVLCRNHSTKWHRIICDRLNAIAKKRTDEPPSTGNNNADGYGYRPDTARTDDDDTTGDHVIRNVLISNTKLCIQVQCSIDNCEVELSCNSRADVCMLSLLEEISLLVGKDNLFKQSLMLIRAWWCCESAAYVGTTVKNYLSDLSLCVMVCAVFNLHHTRIHTPVQALCAFLAEYSAYDGATQAITLQGIVPFKSATSNQPLLPSPLNPVLTGPAAAGEASANVLLTRPILERYWLLMCPPDATNPEQQQHQKIFPSLSSSSEDVFGVDLRGVPNVHHSLDLGSSASSVGEARESSVHEDPAAGSTPIEEAALSAHRQQCSRNLVKFDRSQFNVVDPFSCNNMVLERPSQNRILRLTKVFQSGAAQMSALLTQAHAAGTALDAAALLRSFFPLSMARFVDSAARPDTFNIDASFLTPAMVAQMTRYVTLDSLPNNP